MGPLRADTPDAGALVLPGKHAGLRRSMPDLSYSLRSFGVSEPPVPVLGGAAVGSGGSGTGHTLLGGTHALGRYPGLYRPGGGFL